MAQMTEKPIESALEKTAENMTEKTLEEPTAQIELFEEPIEEQTAKPAAQTEAAEKLVERRRARAQVLVGVAAAIVLATALLLGAMANGGNTDVIAGVTGKATSDPASVPADSNPGGTSTIDIHSATVDLLGAGVSDENAQSTDVETDGSSAADLSTGTTASVGADPSESSGVSDTPGASVESEADMGAVAAVDTGMTAPGALEMVVGPGNLLNTHQIPDSSFIYDTTIADLEMAEPYMDGQTVQIRGEVVGDRILASTDGYCWLTLRSDDDTDAEMSVHTRLSLTEGIDMYGAYGKHGTTVQARGTFNLTCPDHDGLTDLHADHVSVVAKGFLAETVFDILDFLPGFLLVVVGVGLILAYRHVREGLR